MNKQKQNHDGSNVIELYNILDKNKEKFTKATRVMSLLQKQKGLMKKRQSLTNFDEPVLDLHRINGKIETYEKATAGKFIFTHSCGEERFIELRPEDQEIRDYGDKKIRWYSCHENFPFAGWGNPVLDNETVTRGYEMTKATDLKYQERIQGLKNKGKLTWLWVVGGIILAIAFAIMIIPDSFWNRFGNSGVVKSAVNVAPPTVGLLLLKVKNKIRSINERKLKNE